MKALLYQLYSLIPLEIKVPCPNYDIANAAGGIGDFIVGNILGIAFKYGPWFVIALIALLVFTWKTKFGKVVLGILIGAFVALLFLGVITGHPDAFFSGVKGC